MVRQKLIIDTDPGVDDILALIYALHCPHVEILAITTTHGNVSVEHATNNLRILFEVLELHKEHNLSISSMGKNEIESDIPIPYEIYSKPRVAIGAEKPYRGQANIFAKYVHGDNGLHGFDKEALEKLKNNFLSIQHLAKKQKKTDSSQKTNKDQIKKPCSLYHFSDKKAHDEILYQLEKCDTDDITLICIGPCTNLAHAIVSDGPNLPRLSKLKQVYIMGGCISMPFPGGNVTPNAEFNFYADPIAAELVLKSGLPITIIPLDVTETCRLNYGLYQDSILPLAKNSPVPAFCTKFMGKIFEYMELAGKRAKEIKGSGIDFSELCNEEIIEAHEYNARGSDEAATEQNEGLSVAHSTSLAMHDPLCLAVAINNSIMTSCSRYHMDIETNADSKTLGMCIVDGRKWRRKDTTADNEHFDINLTKDGKGPRKIRVATGIDSDKFFDEFMMYTFGLNWASFRHQWVVELN